MSKFFKKQEEKASALVNEFNAKFPVGSKVLHRKIAVKSIPFQEVTVERKAFVSMSFEPVVYFEELSGFYSIDRDFIDYDTIKS